MTVAVSCPLSTLSTTPSRSVPTELALRVRPSAASKGQWTSTSPPHPATSAPTTTSCSAASLRWAATGTPPRLGISDDVKMSLESSASG
eukprot:CAMPEP_0169454048 /NCGR_PEP_ID=MMETSP1042-20121227/15074_1 /TAXON_ID=464988 /ORGANISM="Hemiselmis andersenii, Strain CCMP1180" /LENGTH=88 /DNA_ID=CAMNT_0009566103 /DNA_START=108 /DNA_END=370 /DNA_ORIENTATION=+